MRLFNDLWFESAANLGKIYLLELNETRLSNNLCGSAINLGRVYQLNLIIRLLIFKAA